MLSAVSFSRHASTGMHAAVASDMTHQRYTFQIGVSYLDAAVTDVEQQL